MDDGPKQMKIDLWLHRYLATCGHVSLHPHKISFYQSSLRICSNSKKVKEKSGVEAEKLNEHTVVPIADVSPSLLHLSPDPDGRFLLTSLLLFDSRPAGGNNEGVFLSSTSSAS